MTEPTTTAPAPDELLEGIPGPAPIIPEQPGPLGKSGRPSTRAGRRAAAEARRAERSAAQPDKAPRPSAGKPPKGKAEIARTVAGLHELAGTMALPLAGLPSTGAALAAQAEQAGQVWAALAERYPAVARVFQGTGDGMLFVHLGMVYLPVILAAQAEAATPKEQRAASSADAQAALAALFTQAAAA